MLLLTAAFASGAAFAQPRQVEWTLVDVAEQKSYSVSHDADRLLQGGEFQASPEGSGLRLGVSYGRDEEATRVRVRLADELGKDRGLVVKLSLALEPNEWTWMQDLDTPKALGAEAQSNTTALRGLPGLPYFTDEAEKPEYGRYSTYPVGAVEREGTWLALMRQMTELALVRFIAVGGEEPRLTAEVDLALSEFTDPPREASYELWFASGEAGPGGSMRAALQLVGGREPAVETYPGEWPFGGWMPFADLAGIPNVDEFGFAYQEGGRSPGFCDALGANSFVYFHCAGEFANVDGYERGSEPLPPYEDIVAAFNAVAKGRLGQDGLWDICGIRNADGKVGFRPERTYGDFFCQACVDPDLAYGKGMADNLIRRVSAKPSPEDIDGVYYDGIAVGLDYAPEHLKAADHMLLWDGTLGRPVNYNLWSSAEWARYIHEQFEGTSKLTMLNDSSLSSFPFVGPYIDVPGAEMSIYLSRSQCRLIRALMGNKPFCTLVKADFEQVSQAQIESYMRRCTAYAILFGFFDITPSGANPGSSYWVHPEWFDRDRALFRRYMPLARELLAATWRPVPEAEVTEGEASLEWFGPMRARGDVGGDEVDYLGLDLHYCTLSTDPTEPGDEARSVTLKAPQATTPPVWTVLRSDARLKASLAVELLTGRVERMEQTLTTELTGEDLQVWALGGAEAQARGCLRRAADVVKRRAAYIEACTSTGQALAPWNAYGDSGGAIDTGGHEGGLCLKATKDKPGSAGATQTVVVNHTEPKELVVSAWSKAENATGERSRDYALYVDCYYTDGTAIYGQTAEFDTGTHDWQKAERTIQPEKPVRNINVYLLFRGGHTGTVWFDDVHVALADDPDTNLLRRGDFETSDQPRPLAGDSAEAKRLDELCSALLISPGPAGSVADTDWKAATAALEEMDRIVAATDLGPDTERARRDAEDLRWHIELAQACLKAEAQGPQRPSRLTEFVALATLKTTATGPKQYRATTGNVPQGTIVAVEGNFGGYTPVVLTDGKVNPKGVHWTKVAWASSEHAGAHWIELRFPEATRAVEVRLHAGLDARTLHMPQKLEAQVLEGGEWTAAEGQRLERGPALGLVSIRLTGKPLKQLRIVQPPHGGSTARPDLMWVSEIEVMSK